MDTAPEGYRVDPKGWWDRLAEEDIGAYSNLKAVMDLKGYIWIHWHTSGHHEPDLDLNWDTRLPPECHGQPMYAAPHGWECRVMRSRFPYVSQESYTVH